MTLIYCVLFLWAIGFVLAGWWLITREAVPEQAPPPVPRDPIVAEVDKWAHDWERGRA